MFWFKYTDLLLIYSSKIWQISWHSALNSKFRFYDWIPRFHPRFPHRWIHRLPDFLSLELKGIPLSRIALQLLVTKKSDQLKKKKKNWTIFYFCRYMLFTTEYSFISKFFLTLLRHSNFTSLLTCESVFLDQQFYFQLTGDSWPCRGGCVAQLYTHLMCQMHVCHVKNVLIFITKIEQTSFS